MRIMADQARIVNLDEESKVTSLTDNNAEEIAAMLLNRLNNK